jgi:hypothetical protein
MREFKIGDKVTIKDVDAVISTKFQHLKSIPGMYPVYTMESLIYLKNNFGIFILNHLGSGHYIEIKKYNTKWEILEEHLFHYRDISLPDNLFEV